MGFECCINCPKRVVSCHSDCKEYLKAKAEHDAKMEKIRKEHEVDSTIIGIRRRKFGDK